MRNAMRPSHTRCLIAALYLMWSEVEYRDQWFFCVHQEDQSLCLLRRHRKLASLPTDEKRRHWFRSPPFPKKGSYSWLLTRNKPIPFFILSFKICSRHRSRWRGIVLSRLVDQQISG